MNPQVQKSIKDFLSDENIYLGIRDFIQSQIDGEMKVSLGENVLLGLGVAYKREGAVNAYRKMLMEIENLKNLKSPDSEESEPANLEL
jgi:hypothetical protein